ncbi:hypothetical protein mRhiFer1_010090 [Rhinolophus ferrumequinum]|uniref:Uncharacterized protein n=1 Tax=Rhinolophus ferrumequinum TaxID=59479 RepID=A0A7J7XPJ0_RHIFE|nr:hypothetical protein mRhiFer1_010090 [Rhinolophus ferrumequinum]
MTGVLIRKENTKRDAERGCCVNGHTETRGRNAVCRRRRGTDWSDSYKPRHWQGLRIASHHQKPYSFQGEHGPTHTLISDIRPPEYETTNVCGFKVPSLWSFVMAASPGTLTRRGPKHPVLGPGSLHGCGTDLVVLCWFLLTLHRESGDPAPQHTREFSVLSKTWGLWADALSKAGAGLKYSFIHRYPAPHQ